MFVYIPLGSWVPFYAQWGPWPSRALGLIQSIAEGGKRSGGTGGSIAQSEGERDPVYYQGEIIWNLEKFTLPKIKPWPRNKVIKIHWNSEITHMQAILFTWDNDLSLDPFSPSLPTTATPRKDLKMLTWEKQDSLFYTRVSLKVVILLGIFSNLGYVWTLGG